MKRLELTLKYDVVILAFLSAVYVFRQILVYNIDFRKIIYCGESHPLLPIYHMGLVLDNLLLITFSLGFLLSLSAVIYSLIKKAKIERPLIHLIIILLLLIILLVTDRIFGIHIVEGTLFPVRCE